MKVDIVGERLPQSSRLTAALFALVSFRASWPRLTRTVATQTTTPADTNKVAGQIPHQS